MHDKQIKILLIEDNPGDARLIQEIIKESGNTGYELSHADCLSSGMELLAKNEYDVLLLDLGLPESQGLSTLGKIRSLGLKVPIVVLTSLSDEMAGVEAVKGGIQDYLVKGRVDSNLLMHSIRYAIERKKLENELVRSNEFLEQRVLERTSALKENEEKLRLLIESSQDGIIAYDQDIRFTLWNKAMEQMSGIKRKDTLGKSPFDMFPFLDMIGEGDAYRDAVRGKVTIRPAMPYYVPRTGRRGYFESSHFPFYDTNGIIIGGMAIIRDVTFRRITERQVDTQHIVSEILTESRDIDSAAPRILQTICENLKWDIGIFWLVDRQNNLLRCINIWLNPYIKAPELESFLRKTSFSTCTGSPSFVMAGDKPVWITDITRDNTYPEMLIAAKEGLRCACYFPILFEDDLIGSMTFFGYKIKKPYNDQINVIIDISKKICLFVRQKQSEMEQANLREQLYHIQKMESVGTLAGGVAHDFNNILAIIIGYGNMLEKGIGKDGPARMYVQKILKSAERATNLVQGLLAYSRKQESCQKPVSINSILLQIRNLLLRLIGEDIVLDIAFTDKGCVVMADSGQIEQVLMNLATNARDAMPNGGEMTICTDIVEMGSAFIQANGYGKAGKYVLISVADTGIGMDKETQIRIFEPFFTTKEVGKGTGLGLSIVYGIVKQHGGYITVESEPERGTTFRIYLPVINVMPKEEKPEPLPVCFSGTETILVAEDEEEVRRLARVLLEEAGYKVIEATDGFDAINKFVENKDEIPFLLLDVIMPKKHGIKVYDEIRKIRPDVKVLFMSGYSEHVINTKTIHGEGLQFISKPFTQTTLLKKVREILDNSTASI